VIFLVNIQVRLLQKINDRCKSIEVYEAHI
jgi:hypothetical protein